MIAAKHAKLGQYGSAVVTSVVVSAFAMMTIWTVSSLSIRERTMAKVLAHRQDLTNIMNATLHYISSDCSEVLAGQPLNAPINTLNFDAGASPPVTIVGSSISVNDVLQQWRVSEIAVTLDTSVAPTGPKMLRAARFSLKADSVLAASLGAAGAMQGLRESASLAVIEGPPGFIQECASQGTLEEACLIFGLHRGCSTRQMTTAVAISACYNMASPHAGPHNCNGKVGVNADECCSPNVVGSWFYTSAHLPRPQGFGP